MTKKQQHNLLKMSLVELCETAVNIAAQVKETMHKKDSRVIDRAANDLEMILSKVKRKLGRESLERLESRIDVDFAFWVHTQFIPIEKLEKFETDFKTLVRMYTE